MQKFVKLVGFIAILAIFGLVLGCDEPGPVTLTGNAQAGQILTADTSALGGSGTISYLWRRGGSSIAGANSDTYVVQAADVGSAITVTVNRSDISGSVTSAQTAVVIDNNTGTIGLSYTLINNGTAYSVSSGSSNAVVIVIPAVYQGLPVIEIADSGFTSYTSLTSIVIPNGVTRIGNYAFFHCSNLTSIVLPAGITNIGNFAFQDCGGLTIVFFGGASSANWEGVTIGSSNTALTEANLYYYSETNPETEGLFWSFVDGVPIGATYYSVIFNNDGGSAVVTQIISHGSTATRPTNPTRSGYVFGGWYSDSEFTVEYNFSMPVTSNVTLFVKWVYTVTFVSNGGNTVTTQGIIPGNTATRPTNPTRSGHVFDNWYSDSELTTVYDFSIPVTSNISIYAKWIIQTYTVTFVSNGGTAVDTQIINHGDMITRPTNLSRSGYVFDYWYSNAELTISYNFTSPVISNVTLYARWIEWNAIINNIEMVQISAGTLEWPDATITLSAFKMGKYEVTQELYEAVMGFNPSSFNSYPAAGEIQARRPVEQVSWYDALVFCNKLSIIEGLTPAYSINGSTNPDEWGTVPTSSNATWNSVTVVSGSTGYRLPTEVQWEYACRAGSTTDWYFGDTQSELVNYAWYGANSGNRTHQVGLKLPNAFGLYDMHGNVWEWCWDWWGSLPTSNQTDYTGPVSESGRVIRGGSWNRSAGHTRSSYRDFNPYSGYYSAGFRVVRP